MKLDPEQQSAVNALSGPVCIRAGAGTGKTRTIITRIVHGVQSGAFPVQKVLAVTHSQNAAGEMRHRLDREGVNGVNARTFHAAALAQLKFFWSHTDHDYPLSIIDAGDRYNLLRRAGEKALKRDLTTDEVFDLGSEVGWAKSRMLAPSLYKSAAHAASRSPGLELREIENSYRLYESLKSDARRVDFEDLLSLTASLLESNTEVQSHVHDTYSHFVVDEYQDVDPLQERLLNAWLGPRDDICVVGDSRQSIYAFRGASPEVFDNFAARYPHAVNVNLVRDYRSTPQVVQAANRLIGSRADSLVGQRSPGLDPSAVVFANEKLEETHLVSELKRHHDAGTSYREMAVLYRFNSQSARFESALTAANIPYRVSDSEKFFDRPEIRAVLKRAWEMARDNPDAIGLEVVEEVLTEMGFDRETPPTGTGRARARWDAVMALVDTISEIQGIETLGARFLLDEMLHRTRESHTVNFDAVTLSTLHKAKGLEWDVVMMVNVTEGSLPSAYATTPDLVAEERRLAYVGVTRAREHLTLSASRTNARGWKASPSRFLSGFGVAAKPVARTKTPRRASTTCRDCGSPLAGSAPIGLCASCLPHTTSKLADSLINWRRRVASENQQPAARFLDDELLWRIVSAHPTSLTKLIGVDGFVDCPAGGFGREILSVIRNN